jgi:hypothetical protein
MKKHYKILALALFTAFMTSFIGCKKDAEIPTLSTIPVSQVTTSTALAGGKIISSGSSAIISRGICWGLTSNPTTDFMKTTDGTGTGIFSSNLTGLYPNSTYYFRAYATNSAGTNSSGLTALPGGSRSVNGGFGWLGFTANWWISTAYSDPPPPTTGLYASMNFNNGDLYIADAWDWYPTFEGMSVRWVKDN